MYDDHLFRVSLKCLIQNPEGQILVVKESGRSSWDLPGGGMDHNETIRSAIARELSEEISYKGNFEYELLCADDPALLLTRDIWQLKLVFKVTLESITVGLGIDTDEVVFLDPNSLKNSSHIPEQKIYEYAKKYC